MGRGFHVYVNEHQRRWSQYIHAYPQWWILSHSIAWQKVFTVSKGIVTETCRMLGSHQNVDGAMPNHVQKARETYGKISGNGWKLFRCYQMLPTHVQVFACFGCGARLVL